MLVPAALALLTSINALQNGFAFDDIRQVLGNEFIRRIGNLPLAFTSSVWSFETEVITVTADPYFRPLFTALFILNYAAFGVTSWGWHLVNVLIHMGVASLVFLVLREIVGRPGVAVLAAGLFAVHPVHSESVAWISGITDPLMALFLLPAFYLYLNHRKSGRKIVIAAALVFFFLALLSKETAMVLPLMIAYCEIFYFEDAGTWRRRIVRAATIAGLFLLPAAAYFLMRYNAIGGLVMPGEARFGVDIVLATVPMVLVKYVVLMLAPVSYSIHHYTAPVTTMISIDFIGPLLLLMLVIVGVVLTRSRAFALASVWFIVWLLPVLAGLRLFRPQHFVQERYLYLASIGVCLALALGIEWLATRESFRINARRAVVAGTAALILLWSAVHINQNRVWRDTLSVFRHAVAVNPRSGLARVDLAVEYFAKGDRQAAEGEALHALELDPNCLDAYIVLAQFAVANGKLDSAIDYLEQAKSKVVEGPQKRGYLARICYDLGLTYEDRNVFDAAEYNLRKSVEILPYVKSWYALGNFYFARGRYEEALEMYELALSVAPPGFAPLRLKLARTYDRLNHIERARDEYLKYLDLAPRADDRPEVWQRVQQLRTGQ